MPLLSANNTNTSENIEGNYMFIPHLISGFACMNFFSTLSCDLDFVRGKLGCRFSAFLLYLGCRYFGMLSIVATLTYNDVYLAAIEPLNYICQIASSLSMGFAHTIMAFRLFALFPNVYFGIGLQLICFALWALLLTGMWDTARPWTPHISIHTGVSVLMLLISTTGLILTVVHAFYVCRHEHQFNIRACWRLVWKDNVPEFAVMSSVAVPAAVLYYLDRSPLFWHHFVRTSSSPL
ncbi:hypothetical protein C8Q80DRAFT_1267305 [Daedaleopsis nitida]|nr:hypothetical protein C8Q80DRAFT_1267305 [Daedaleopsis nitida]